MADCKLSQEMRINGITPVDNLFISEFMLGAPGDFVKVYIYALMQCYMGLEGELDSIAHDLSMDREKVDSAFMYWVRKGVIKKLGSHYSFESPKTVVYCNAIPKADSLNNYKDFNAGLAEIMAGRNLTPADFEMAYDWIEIYGMSKNCVLEMVNYAVTKKYKAGIHVSFNTLNKLAISWTDMGINTADKAREYIDTQIIITSDAKTILHHLSQFRNPTVDEYRLLEKWEKDYGFNIEALISCCSQMVYSKNPSFALLDAIVEKYHAMGINTADAIEKERQHDDDMFNVYREIIQRCGGFGSATKAQKELIDSLLKDGFNKQGLLYICDYLVGQDKKGLSHTVKLAQELQNKGITDENAVCEELESRNELSGQVKEFLETAGFSRNPSQKDMEMYKSYRAALGSHELMLRAAKLASASKNRSDHLLRLLDDWKAKGIKSLDEATDVMPEPVKKDAEKKQYMKSDKSYSDKDLFDIFE